MPQQLFIQQENDHKSCTISHAPPLMARTQCPANLPFLMWAGPGGPRQSTACAPRGSTWTKRTTCRLCESGVYCTRGYADKAACPRGNAGVLGWRVSAAQWNVPNQRGPPRVGNARRARRVPAALCQQELHQRRVAAISGRARVGAANAPARHNQLPGHRQWRTQPLSAFQGQVARGVQSDTVCTCWTSSCDMCCATRTFPRRSTSLSCSSWPLSRISPWQRATRPAGARLQPAPPEQLGGGFAEHCAQSRARRHVYRCHAEYDHTCECGLV